MRREKQSIEGIWSNIAEWCKRLSTSVKYITPPGEIEQRILEVARDDVEVIEKYRHSLEMIEWFHTSFQKSPTKNPESFRRAVLFYFWDEWLTLEEQVFLTFSTKLDVLECIRENQFRLGSTLVNRFMDPKTREVQYLCENGKICVKAIIDEIKRDKDKDKIQSFKVNDDSTGESYGFIIPKNGEVVFKTAEPPTEGKKVSKGKECNTVSTTAIHIRNLIEIGNILKAAGKTDFDLTNAILFGTRKVKNATRTCTLLDILIRYLDAENVQGKRWFFRPVEAFYIGHKGVLRSGKK